MGRLNLKLAALGFWNIGQNLIRLARGNQAGHPLGIGRRDRPRASIVGRKSFNQRIIGAHANGLAHLPISL